MWKLNIAKQGERVTMASLKGRMNQVAYRGLGTCWSWVREANERRQGRKGLAHIAHMKLARRWIAAGRQMTVETRSSARQLVLTASRKEIIDNSMIGFEAGTSATSKNHVEHTLSKTSLRKLKVSQLREECRQRNLEEKGLKDDLIDRLITSDKGDVVKVCDELASDQRNRNDTGMQITFLGTSGGSPTLRRNVTCIALEINLHRSVNETFLFDCGEATQTRLLQSKLKSNSISRIFITHMHGDHIFGLPGVICSLSNVSANQRKDPFFDKAGEKRQLHIYGPPGLYQYLFSVLKLSFTQVAMPITIYEYSDGNERHPLQQLDKRGKLFVKRLLPDESSVKFKKTLNGVIEKDDSYKSVSWSRGPNNKGRRLGRWEGLTWTINLGDNSDVSITAAPLKHRVDCWGYVINEGSTPGKIDAEECKKKGLPPGPAYKDLKNGIPVQTKEGHIIKPEDVVGPSQPGRKVVILGDTCDNRWIAKPAKNADVVVHEATFNSQMIDRARKAGHSTAAMAGNFGKQVNAGNVILTHFSPRYDRNYGYDSADVHSEMTAQEELEEIKLLQKEARASFKKNTVFAASDLMTFCIGRKDANEPTKHSNVNVSND